MNKFKYLLILFLFMSDAVFAEKYKIKGTVIGYVGTTSRHNNNGECYIAIKTSDTKYNGYYHQTSHTYICDIAIKFYQLNEPVVLWGERTPHSSKVSKYRYEVRLLEVYRDKVKWEYYPDGWK